MRRIDALPRARTAAVDTTGCPSGSHLRAGTAAYPAPPIVVWLLGRTRSLSHAPAVADDRGLLTFARCRVVGGVRRESVHALESAGVSILTGGNAVIGVVTLRQGGGRQELRNSQTFWKSTCNLSTDYVRHNCSDYY